MRCSIRGERPILLRSWIARSTGDSLMNWGRVPTMLIHVTFSVDFAIAGSNRLHLPSSRQIRSRIGEARRNQWGPNTQRKDHPGHPEIGVPLDIEEEGTYEKPAACGLMGD